MDGLARVQAVFQRKWRLHRRAPFFFEYLGGDAAEVRSTLCSALSGSAQRLVLLVLFIAAMPYAGYVALTQNPNAMYDKDKFCLQLWYDGPANLMSDIVKRCMC